MNENENKTTTWSKVGAESSRDKKNLKINEHRPTAVPKVKMKAADVLATVNDMVGKHDQRIENLLQTVERSADRSRQTIDAAVHSIEQTKTDIINQVPKELKITHVFDEEDRRHLDNMRDTMATAEYTLEQAVKQSAVVAKMELKNVSAAAAKNISNEVSDFKTWCSRWLYWVVGLASAALCLAVLSIYLGVKLYSANKQIEKMERNMWEYKQLQQFKADNPKTFRQWENKQYR